MLNDRTGTPSFLKNAEETGLFTRPSDNQSAPSIVSQRTREEPWVFISIGAKVSEGMKL